MAAGEQIVHLEVFEACGWICGICQKPVDRNLRQPNLMCATIDHKVPISVCIEQGWPIETIHTFEQVQLSHLDCNLKKAAGTEIDQSMIQCSSSREE
jgi:hypothetical protein